MVKGGTGRPDPTDPHNVKKNRQPLLNHDGTIEAGEKEKLKTGKRKLDPIHGPHKYH